MMLVCMAVMTKSYEIAGSAGDSVAFMMYFKVKLAFASLARVAISLKNIISHC